MNFSVVMLIQVFRNGLRFIIQKSYKTRNKKIIELTGFDIEKQKYNAVQRLKELSPENYVTENIIFKIDQDGKHSETFWKRELKKALM